MYIFHKQYANKCNPKHSRYQMTEHTAAMTEKDGGKP